MQHTYNAKTDDTKVDWIGKNNIHRTGTVSVFTCSLSRLSGHPSYFSYWPDIIAGLRIRIRKGSVFVLSCWIRTRIRIRIRVQIQMLRIRLPSNFEEVPVCEKTIHKNCLLVFFSQGKNNILSAVQKSFKWYKNQNGFELAFQDPEPYGY